MMKTHVLLIAYLLVATAAIAQIDSATARIVQPRRTAVDSLHPTVKTRLPQAIEIVPDKSESYALPLPDPNLDRRALPVLQTHLFFSELLYEIIQCLLPR
jgi:hypothetical protein